MWNFKEIIRECFIQVVIPHPETNTEEGNRSSRMACKGAALHLAKWMKSHPGSGSIPPEPEPEV